MIKVQSSNLHYVDYNPYTGTLTIQFHNGTVYEYYNVPKNVFDGLLAAPSKGKFHHRYIKNSYHYHRIK